MALMVFVSVDPVLSMMVAGSAVDRVRELPVMGSFDSVDLVLLNRFYLVFETKF